jgi:hypothetical protein
MRVRFGKHAGCEVSELPDGYLRWLSTLDLRDPLRRAVDDEIQTRIQRDATRRAFGVTPSVERGVDRTTVEEIVGAGLRSLAKKYHPDLEGGSEEDMKRINLAASCLREMAANVLPEVTWSLADEVARRMGRKRWSTR